MNFMQNRSRTQIKLYVLALLTVLFGLPNPGDAETGMDVVILYDQSISMQVYSPKHIAGQRFVPFIHSQLPSANLVVAGFDDRVHSPLRVEAADEIGLKILQAELKKRKATGLVTDIEAPLRYLAEYDREIALAVIITDGEPEIWDEHNWYLSEAVQKNPQYEDINAKYRTLASSGMNGKALYRQLATPYFIRNMELIEQRLAQAKESLGPKLIFLDTYGQYRYLRKWSEMAAAQLIVARPAAQETGPDNLTAAMKPALTKVKNLIEAQEAAQREETIQKQLEEQRDSIKEHSVQKDMLSRELELLQETLSAARDELAVMEEHKADLSDEIAIRRTEREQEAARIRTQSLAAQKQKIIVPPSPPQNGLFMPVPLIYLLFLLLFIAFLILFLFGRQGQPETLSEEEMREAREAQDRELVERKEAIELETADYRERQIALIDSDMEAKRTKKLDAITKETSKLQQAIEEEIRRNKETALGQIAEHTQAAAELSSKKDQLNKDLHELDGKLAEKKAAMARLDEKTAARMQELSEREKAAEQEAAHYKEEQIALIQIKMEEIRLRKLADLVKEAEEKRQAVDREIKQTRESALAQIAEHTQTVAELSSNKDLLIKDMEELDGSLAEKRTAIAGLEEEKTAQEKNISAREKAYEQKAMDFKEEQFASIRQEVEEARARKLAGVEEEIAVNRQEMEKEIGEMRESALTTLAEQKEKAAAELADKKDQKKNAEKELRKLDDKLALHQNAIDKLKEKTAVMEHKLTLQREAAEKEAAQYKEEQIALIRNEIEKEREEKLAAVKEKTEKERQAVQEEIRQNREAALADIVEQRQTAFTELAGKKEKTQKELQELEQKLAEKRSTITGMEDDIATQAKKRNERDDKIMQEAQLYKEELFALIKTEKEKKQKKMLVDLKKEARQKRHEMEEEIRQTREAALAQLTEDIREAAELSTKKDQIMNDLEELDGRLTEKQASIAELAGKKGRTQQELQVIDEKLAAEQTHLTKLKKETTAQAKELSERKKAIEQEAATYKNEQFDLIQKEKTQKQKKMRAELEEEIEQERRRKRLEEKLQSMHKAELMAVCQKMNIECDPILSKDEIIDLIWKKK